ncbi:hypothetical protein AVEN_227030-1 [Araneus ventricosus]|uniref:Uncharacterized protein n=1 Tax=Araneus ventricosus TaxID=182803 RepID=A0A4Y2M5S1_ARAVE|nr:hypothetical protein AVEN_227030-1 [Araneus ventricosus]
MTTKAGKCSTLSSLDQVIGSQPLSGGPLAGLGYRIIGSRKTGQESKSGELQKSSLNIENDLRMKLSSLDQVIGSQPMSRGPLTGLG